MLPGAADGIQQCSGLLCDSCGKWPMHRCSFSSAPPTKSILDSHCAERCRQHVNICDITSYWLLREKDAGHMNPQDDTRDAERQQSRQTRPRVETPSNAAAGSSLVSRAGLASQCPDCSGQGVNVEAI